MKYIWLGIKDYCKDRYHDWLVYHLFKFYKRPMYFDSDKGLIPIVEWREGSVKHYIQQRKYKYDNVSTEK